MSAIRPLPLLMVALLCLGLVACGDNSKEGNQPTDPTNQPDPGGDGDGDGDSGPTNPDPGGNGHPSDAPISGVDSTDAEALFRHYNQYSNPGS